MKPGYFTVPPLTGVKPIDETPVIVEDLVIGRTGHGQIFFPGKTNLKGVDLDLVVYINNRSVAVYPDDNNKPPLGHGLNKPAIVTLHKVWRRKEDTAVGFLKRIESLTEEMGAEFLQYLEESGSWSFRVSHFSKYGLNDSDEELDPQVIAQNNQKGIQNPSQNMVAGKEHLNNQNLNVNILGGSAPLEGEETMPKALFFDASYTDEVEINPYIDAPLQLEDLKNLSNTMSPSQSMMKFSLNNERLLGLKATLFEDDHMEDDENVFKEQNVVRPFLQDNKRRKDEKISILSWSTSFQDRLKDLPTIQSAPAESPTFRTPRRHVTSRQFSGVTPYNKSLLYEKNHMLLDTGCFHGLSFRVGWAPQMNFMHKVPMQPTNIQDTVSSFKLGFAESTMVKTLPSQYSAGTLHVSSLDTTFLSSSVFQTRANMLENLHEQLSHKTFSMVNGIPYFSAKDGVELMNSHYNISQKQRSEGKRLEYVFSVWNLCTALWGQFQEEEEESPNSYNHHIFRKELFSQWLISSTAGHLKEKVVSTKDHLSIIFSLLTGNRTEEACRKALEFNYLRLGLLLSQVGSSTSFRNVVLKQLENWLQFEVDQFVDAELIKIYTLLAGKLVWKTNRGKVINCCEDLDWKRAMSLHLWYQCLPTASIHDVLLAYEESFKGVGPHGQYSSFPYPSYIEDDHELHILGSQSESTPLDMCFYLLKLYCDRSTPLGKMFVPLTYGSSQLDYSLSWMVFQVLLSLGYQHLPASQAQLLHLNFASQLEVVGLWEWAIFVLLHINDTPRRKALVMEVLMRHVSLNPDKEETNTEDFLVEKLHVPRSWLFAAKAVLARSLGRYKDEAWCLLKSDQWAESHQIVVDKIAPDCIIHEQFDELKSYLTELSHPEISKTILGWSMGGEVYSDYIYVSEKIEQMMCGQVKPYEMEELHPMLISLSNRICSLKCTGARSRLCQSEMSKKTVILLRALITLRRDLRSGAASPSGNDVLMSLLPKLPMPEDYALQELRSTVRSYMLEVTSAGRNFS